MARNDPLAAVAAARRRLQGLREQQREAAAWLASRIVAATQAGASQREVAARAGVSQPYVAQVLAANRGRFVPRSKLGARLAARRDRVIEIVRRHGADNVVVFGSVARGDDDEKSDIDLMVDIPDDMDLFTLAQMEHEVSAELGVPVDLVPARLLKPAVRQAVDLEMVPL